MSNIQYYRKVEWDTAAKDVGTEDSGLSVSATYTTAGVPVNTAGKWIPGAFVQNEADSLWYRNAGSTAAPNFVLASGGGSFSLPITTVLSSGTATYDQTNNFLGLGIPGTGQIFDTGTGGVNMLASIDATGFGGPKDTTIVGYLTIGGTGSSNTFYEIDTVAGTSTIRSRAESISGASATININAVLASSSINFDFSGGDTYTFPNTQAGAGQVLTDVAGNGTLTWETPGASSLTGYTLAENPFGNTALGDSTALSTLGARNTWIGAGAGFNVAGIANDITVVGVDSLNGSGLTTLDSLTILGSRITSENTEITSTNTVIVGARNSFAGDNSIVVGTNNAAGAGMTDAFIFANNLNPIGAYDVNFANVMIGNATPASETVAIGWATKITINNATQRINITNVPAYADDATATGAGLVTGDVYKTTTGGSTFLKIVP